MLYPITVSAHCIGQDCNQPIAIAGRIVAVSVASGTLLIRLLAWIADRA